MKKKFSSQGGPGKEQYGGAGKEGRGVQKKRPRRGVGGGCHWPKKERASLEHTSYSSFAVLYSYYVIFTRKENGVPEMSEPPPLLLCMFSGRSFLFFCFHFVLFICTSRPVYFFLSRSEEPESRLVLALMPKPAWLRTTVDDGVKNSGWVKRAKGAGLAVLARPKRPILGGTILRYEATARQPRGYCRTPESITREETIYQLRMEAALAAVMTEFGCVCILQDEKLGVVVLRAR